MALLINETKVFYHIPRTGGNYVRSVIRAIGVNTREVHHPHSNIVDNIQLSGLESFTVIRHPMDWYKSWYRYREMRNWPDNHKVGMHKPGDSFVDFVNKMLMAYPSGYFTSKVFANVPFVSHVLRTDQLTDQLRILIESWGYSWPDHIPKENSSNKNISTWLPNELEKKLIGLEKRVINYIADLPSRKTSDKK